MSELVSRLVNNAKDDYEEDLFEILVAPQKVQVDRYENGYFYLDTPEGYSPLWEDVMLTVLDELDDTAEYSRARWQSNEECEIHRSDISAWQDEKLVSNSQVNLWLREANKTYKAVCKKLEKEGYIVFPYNWNSSTFGKTKERRAFLKAATQDHVSGKFGYEAQETYSKLLERFEQLGY